MQSPFVIGFSSRYFWILRGLIILLIAAGFTSFCISVSERIGRLSTVPNYDDCVYMLSAKIRSFNFYQGGLGAVIEDMLYGRTIHSPYSEFLAIAGYAVFGDRDRAPYQANVFLVVVYLGFLSWLLRSTPLVPWLATLFIFLNLPIAKMGVVEFRPDIFWGICVGFGAIYILISPRLLNGKKSALIAGAIFAAAYLAKPTTFALTTVVLFASWAARLIHAWIFRKNMSVSVRNTFRSLITAGAAIFLLAGWYYIFFGATIWEYFFKNTFGLNKDIWPHTNGWQEAVFYYINGAGAASSVGYLGLPVGLAGLSLVIWRLYTGPAIEKVRCAFLVGIILLIYIVNTVGAMKSEFLGSSLYMLAIFGTAYLINCFYVEYRLLAPAKGTLTSCILIFMLTTALFFQQWPIYSDWTKGYHPISRQTYREATNSVIDILGSLNQHPRVVLFLQAGPVVMECIGMWMLGNYRENPELISAMFIRSLHSFDELQKQSDVIITPDVISAEGNKDGRLPRFPVVEILPDILEKLTSDSNFTLYRTIRTSDDTRVRIYIRDRFLRIPPDLTESK